MPDSPHLPTTSPLFVHSHLDRGASLQDWLQAKESAALGTDVGVARSLQQPQRSRHQGKQAASLPVLPYRDGAAHMLSSDEDDSDPHSRSLTRQLAETAVGVREMSKQLGRARIRVNVQSVVIVTEARDNRLIKFTRELALYLMLKPRHGHRGLIVYVDHQLRHSKRFDAAGIERDHPELFQPFPSKRSSSSSLLSSFSSTFQDDSRVQQTGQLRYWTSEMCSRSPHLFDFAFTLGGDRVVLLTSWLFQRIVPPILPFALGSPSFLTNFDYADHQAMVDSAIDGGIRVNLRMRFTCTVYRGAFDKGRCRRAILGEADEILMKDLKKGGWEALEGGWSGVLPDGGKRPVETFEVLNDLVVDRGPSPYVSLSSLELFGDEHHMATVQAHGLCVATPTGSTAYSLSAGGSLVHPEIPTILITPIYPHTLSCRPMLLPDTMELRVYVPYNSRCTQWVSFDGRGRLELRRGDHIKISASKYPFPTVCADKQSTDWFRSISRTLKWNECLRQKSFVVEEEGPTKTSCTRGMAFSSATDCEPLEEESGEEATEDEDTFDIDDSSPDAPNGEQNAMIPVQSEQSAVESTKMWEVATAAVVHKLAPKSSRSAKWRSKSGLHSEAPHLPDHYHSVFTSEIPSPAPSDSSDSSLSNVSHVQRGVGEDRIHRAQLYFGRRRRIPQERDLDDHLQTPAIPVDDSDKRSHPVPRASLRKDRRAFAVWGKDDGESGTSDSDL